MLVYHSTNSRACFYDDKLNFYLKPVTPASLHLYKVHEVNIVIQSCKMINRNVSIVSDWSKQYITFFLLLELTKQSIISFYLH